MRRLFVALLGFASVAFAAGGAEADCTCRARGVVVEHGQTACIPTPDGVRLARCEKVSNVASWTFLNAPCPQVLREQMDEPLSVTATAQVLP